MGYASGYIPPDYHYVVRNYQYLVSKFLMGGSSSDDTAISLYGLGDNNTISGNHIFKGRGVGVSLYGPDDNPTLGTEIYDNILEKNPSINLLISTGHNHTKIYDNFISDCNINIRLHNIDPSGGYNDTIYIYKNKFWNPELAGEHIKLQILNAKYWIYHNSFSGGGVGFGNGGSNINMTNISLLNNLFSGITYSLYYGSQVGGYPRGIELVDYNFFAPLTLTYFPPLPVWWGEHNINQSEPLWGYYEIPDFLLQEGSPAIDSGIDLSQEFTINGTNYNALPGMEPGYFRGDAPDMGAVEYNGTAVSRITALFGTNPINNNNYDSDSQNITFDFKCSFNSSVSYIQLWTNSTGTWHANYTNNSYTNGTWLNITINEIPEGIYKWAVFCNTSNSSDWTNTNRTFIINLTSEENQTEDERRGGGGGGGGGSGGAQQNLTNQTNLTNQSNQTIYLPNLNNTNNSINYKPDEPEEIPDKDNQSNILEMLLKYWWLILIIVVISIILFVYILVSRNMKQDERQR